MTSHIYQGHYARKRFGQHFLHDQSIIENIIRAIQPQHGESMIEIGPGLGALTVHIGRLLNDLVVIEIDHDLILRLQNNPLLKQKLTIFQQDALTFDFSRFARSQTQILRICGNLPYNIATPLILHLFNHISVIHDMHFMLQEEVANRLLAHPGNKSYGRLSVMAQYYCDILPVLNVPSQSFTPPPKVRSKVVRLIPIRHSKELPNHMYLLSCVTRAAFSQRRKTLRNSLSHLIPSEVLLHMHICPKLRAENISVMQYCQLARWLGKI
ncbi:16S rRNA (adenine(1518)-N(6)/adenine(1519)-N(6))-dimethyltransferase RsmA [Candidatus Erwinia haradaeae]|uniref:Ribosomal RNA small subunit methyltransferase A n=1 Tax=Candidatus Erwinia haradaeae TaxID=1922217 RepID=A0A451D956_9GAMM|nr:16S rRNA (adenine(1518)-N(6)/adenine(1519)-N(6))-dimethyltransferase RsmA [Candidatus Erwinia haradaeae]VFP82829.1 Ribosomal RNA small subunit methyltransferase A [Candidatus Erwinia haradaeae]